jgi:hypothetical protein
MKNTITWLAVAGLVLALAPATQAATLIDPGDLTATANDTPRVTRPPSDVVDGTGMTGTGITATHNTDGLDMWLGGNIVAWPKWFRVDLGASYDLENMLVWNYHRVDSDSFSFSGIGVNQVDIYYSTNSAANASDFTGLEWSLLGTAGTRTFTEAPETPVAMTYNDDISLTGVTARVIGLDIKSNHGYPADFAGLSQLQFYEVPEPATMSLLAIGGIALIRRRRR